MERVKRKSLPSNWQTPAKPYREKAISLQSTMSQVYAECFPGWEARAHEGSNIKIRCEQGTENTTSNASPSTALLSGHCTLKYFMSVDLYRLCICVQHAILTSPSTILDSRATKSFEHPVLNSEAVEPERGEKLHLRHLKVYTPKLQEGNLPPQIMPLWHKDYLELMTSKSRHRRSSENLVQVILLKETVKNISKQSPFLSVCHWYQKRGMIESLETLNKGEGNWLRSVTTPCPCLLCFAW